jgi:peptide-methionine (S)-S-oxide reductase
MSNQTAIFAAGCFWCIEAVYNRLKGVHNATSGYINGHTPPRPLMQKCAAAAAATPKR